MMTDREKIRTEIEARLTQLGETINSLRLKAEQRQGHFQAPIGPSLDAIESKREEVHRSLSQMESLDDKTYTSTVDQLKQHLDDIDGSLREALAHFK
ncbi:MAG TPA: hypothetical protein VLT88_12235 [Desulfosarcina sp.]|nr:hypothetical protein [Desulfosarcina sp.]